MIFRSAVGNMSMEMKYYIFKFRGVDNFTENILKHPVKVLQM